MNWSDHQKAIFAHAATSDRSLFVEAVAGAGKTTTLVETCRHLTGRVAFLAFNKKIADEISAKLRKAGINYVESGTFHSFGLKAWTKFAGKCRIDGYKVGNDFDAWAQGEDRKVLNYRSFVTKLVSLAKQRGLGIQGSIEDTAQWFAIVEHFDLENELAGRDGELPSGVTVEGGIKLAQFFLKRSIALSTAKGAAVIDFDDMIYMPLYKGVKFPQYDNVLVDEAQDTNPVRRAMVKVMI